MMDIQEINVTSFSTSIGFSAALRLATVMGVDVAALWFKGGAEQPVDVDKMELQVQYLGAYVCGRTAMPGAEQLYRKAHELKLHSLDENGFATQPLWLRVAYRVFAVTTWTAKCELQDAQDRARDEEELRRMAAPAVQPEDQPAAVATDAAEGGGVGAADEAAPPPPDLDVVETELATAAASPEESVADTAGAGEPSPVPAAEPQQQKRKR
jgi:hypothetical protein